MMLTLDHHEVRVSSDTDEARHPRSLDLALRRMGFAARSRRESAPRWPRTWSRSERNDAAPDWRPL